MSGVPLRGRALLAALKPLTKPVAGLRPLGSRSLTLGREGVPPPSPASPHGDRQGRRTVPPISPSAKRALRAASLSGPLDEIGSPSATAQPMLPRAALPPSHPQLAAWQAVGRGHPPSRLQGALPMKAPAVPSASATSAPARPASPAPAKSPSTSTAKTASSAIRSFSIIPATPPPATTSSSASAPNTKPTSNAMAP